MIKRASEKNRAKLERLENLSILSDESDRERSDEELKVTKVGFCIVFRGFSCKRLQIHH